MKNKLTTLALAGLCIMIHACSPEQNPPEGMTLVWSDEFEYSGLPDTTHWSYDVGDGCPNVCGWGNDEQQYYTKDRLENARVENGNLIIEARKEDYETRKYTSARLVSKLKGDWLYGKIEARAKLPTGRGTWPAIWMLSTDWEYGGWPESGEIDIMEYVGYDPGHVHGTVHTKAFNHIIGTQRGKQVDVLDAEQAFHVYGINWTPEKIDFLVDDVVFHTFSKEDIAANPDKWPFDKRFHLILNMAVGGGWGGKQGIDESIWPQKYLIDYVRVYQKLPTE